MVWWVIPLIIIVSSGISMALSYSMTEGMDTRSEGNKLDDLAVQTSTYGKAIPMLYGTMRFAGNVIWSTNIKEAISTSTQSSGGGKGGGKKSTSTTTTYSYSVSVAIALCEGWSNPENNNHKPPKTRHSREHDNPDYIMSPRTCCGVYAQHPPRRRLHAQHFAFASQQITPQTIINKAYNPLLQFTKNQTFKKMTKNNTNSVADSKNDIAIKVNIYEFYYKDFMKEFFILNQRISAIFCRFKIKNYS